MCPHKIRHAISIVSIQIQLVLHIIFILSLAVLTGITLFRYLHGVLWDVLFLIKSSIQWHQSLSLRPQELVSEECAQLDIMRLMECRPPLAYFLVSKCLDVRSI